MPHQKHDINLVRIHLQVISHSLGHDGTGRKNSMLIHDARHPSGTQDTTTTLLAKATKCDKQTKASMEQIHSVQFSKIV